MAITRCNSSVLSLTITTPQSLPLDFVSKGYQFWGPTKAHRIGAGLSRNFANVTLKQFDEVDFIKQQHELAKALYGGAESDVVKNYTEHFCSHTSTIVNSVYLIGAYSAFFGPRYGDPLVLQNYLYYYTAFNTATNVAFKIHTQAADVIGLSYGVRFFAVMILIILIPLLVFDLVILRRMIKEHNSSAFTIHLYLCCLDPFLFASLMTLGFPIGFLAAQGKPCVDMAGELIDMTRHPWTMDVPYRTEESLTCLRNLLLTMLMGDRVFSITFPMHYMKHFDVNFASKCFFAAFTITTVMLGLLFANSWYLSWYFDPRTTYNIFAVARTILLVFIIFVMCLQALLPTILFAKLLANYSRFKKIKNDKRKHGTHIFLLLFTTYNMTVASSLYAFLIGDTFFQLLLMGHCNGCLYFYETLEMFCKMIDIVIAFFQPLGSSVGLILHITFLQSYRTECVKLLRKMPLLRRLPGIKTTSNSSLISVISANSERNRLRRAENQVAVTARWAAAANAATTGANQNKPKLRMANVAIELQQRSQRYRSVHNSSIFVNMVAPKT